MTTLYRAFLTIFPFTAATWSCRQLTSIPILDDVTSIRAWCRPDAERMSMRCSCT